MWGEKRIRSCKRKNCGRIDQSLGGSGWEQFLSLRFRGNVRWKVNPTMESTESRSDRPKFVRNWGRAISDTLWPEEMWGEKWIRPWHQRNLGQIDLTPCGQRKCEVKRNPTMEPKECRSDRRKFLRKRLIEISATVFSDGNVRWKMILTVRLPDWIHWSKWWWNRIVEFCQSALTGNVRWDRWGFQLALMRYE
jgi:hypothetical protein